MEFTDGLFYLRRSTDPDEPIAGAKSMRYTCTWRGVGLGQDDESAATYEFARNEYCEMPTLIRVYDGSDNPGTDVATRAKACALACAQQLPPKNEEDWYFTADVFSVTELVGNRDIGRCYCGRKDLCNFGSAYNIYYTTYNLFQ